MNKSKKNLEELTFSIGVIGVIFSFFAIVASLITIVWWRDPISYKCLFTSIILLITFFIVGYFTEPNEIKKKEKQKPMLDKKRRSVEINGVVYPVYERKSGTFYILRRSRNNKIYEQKIKF